MTTVVISGYFTLRKYSVGSDCPNTQSTHVSLSEILTLTTKIDHLEAHSRRNHLRFNGIKGDQNEDLSFNETKIRQFISTELNITEMAEVEI